MEVSGNGRRFVSAFTEAHGFTWPDITESGIRMFRNNNEKIYYKGVERKKNSVSIFDRIRIQDETSISTLGFQFDDQNVINKVFSFIYLLKA